MTAFDKHPAVAMATRPTRGSGAHTSHCHLSSPGIFDLLAGDEGHSGPIYATSSVAFPLSSILDKELFFLPF